MSEQGDLLISSFQGFSLFCFFVWLFGFAFVCFGEKKGTIKLHSRTSLVAQWLRTPLPMQGTWVPALVQEYPTCRGATKPVHHNYRACTLEPASHNY